MLQLRTSIATATNGEHVSGASHHHDYKSVAPSHCHRDVSVIAISTTLMWLLLITTVIATAAATTTSPFVRSVLNCCGGISISQ